VPTCPGALALGELRIESRDRMPLPPASAGESKPNGGGYRIQGAWDAPTLTEAQPQGGTKKCS
jgi:hypothetical protein